MRHDSSVYYSYLNKNKPRVQEFIKLCEIWLAVPAVICV